MIYKYLYGFTLRNIKSSWREEKWKHAVVVISKFHNIICVFLKIYKTNTLTEVAIFLT